LAALVKLALLSWFKYFQGRAIGVALGCLLGMLPLMFLPTKKKKHSEKPTEEDVPLAEKEL
jgi:hypothetical protein